MNAKGEPVDDLTAAVAAHRGGDLAGAWAGYHRVLERDPFDFNALHLCSLVALARGERSVAKEYVGAALAIVPDNVAARFNLGQIVFAEGDFDRAIEAFTIVTTVDSANADAWNALALGLRAAGKLDRARGAAERGAAAQPENVAVHVTLAITCEELGQSETAIATLERVRDRASANAVVLRNLANLYHRHERFADALATAQQVLALDAQCSQSHVLSGKALFRLGRVPEARAAFIEARRLDPASAPAAYGLSLIASLDVQYAESLELGRSAIAHDPTLIEAQWHVACLTLLLGDIDNGLRNLHWITELRANRDHYVYRERLAQWDGSPLRGGTLLLTDEQGYGDIIQMLRFVPSRAETGGDVVIEIRPALAELVARSFPDARIMIHDGQPLSGDAFKAQLPIMQLAAARGITAAALAPRIPYLSVDPDKVAAMRSRLRIDRRTVNVGIVWRGNPGNAHDAARSTPLAAWSPLGAISGVRYFSLGWGASAGETAAAPFALEPAHELLATFDDSAALIANLDLVIGVDTAPTHLAGALGTPVFLANARRSDWRWMLERTDSPWYPTMRIFRQSDDERWEPVFAAIAGALERFVKSSGALPR